MDLDSFPSLGGGDGIATLEAAAGCGLTLNDPGVPSRTRLTIWGGKGLMRRGGGGGGAGQAPIPAAGLPAGGEARGRTPSSASEGEAETEMADDSSEDSEVVVALAAQAAPVTTVSYHIAEPHSLLHFAYGPTGMREHVRRLADEERVDGVKAGRAM